MQLVAFAALKKKQQQHKDAQGEHEESPGKVQRWHPREPSCRSNNEAASTLLAMVSLLGAALACRELTHTVAAAARQETAARFAFDNHVASWRLGMPYEECRPSQDSTSGGADYRTLAAPVAIGGDEYSQFSDRLARRRRHRRLNSCRVPGR